MRREREAETTMSAASTNNNNNNTAQQPAQPQQQQNTNNTSNKPPVASSSSASSHIDLKYYFFSKEDLVWIHPKRGYPLWPAEVQEMHPKTHTVKVNLICPPEESVATLSQHASKLLYFDKFLNAEAMNKEIEKKLHRERFDVSKFEQTFKNAVSIANKLASCPLNPTAVREDSIFCVSPIGVVHSPFRSHCDAPRQPSTGAQELEAQGGVIRVAPELVNGLQDLKGFERAWVMFHFSFSEVENPEEEEKKKSEDEKSKDENKKTDNESSSNNNNNNNNTNASTIDPRFIPSTAYSTMIVPPRDTKKRGVFATRTPHRPNFIGLSCVRVLDVRGSDVHITDHDLLHGTPVLDIKPYLPFCDSHPNAKHGWVEALNRSGKGKGDHRAKGSTEYNLTRTRGLTLEKVMGGSKEQEQDKKNDDNDDE